jgi:two-component system CheB/CheR fusion protein
MFTTVDGLISGWCGASERLLGYTQDEALGMSLSRLFTPEDLDAGLDMQELALVHHVGRSEDDRWHVRKDGTRFWASGVLQWLRLPDGSTGGLCKIIRDKTDSRTQMEAAQNRLALRERELEARNRSIATVMHELRGPLAPMNSALELLRREDALSMRDKALNTLSRQVVALRTLVDDFREATGAIARQATELKRSHVVLQDIVSEVCEGQRETAARRGLTLSVTLPPLPIVLDVDPVRIGQMIGNLLDNSVKYTPAGGHVSVSATIEAEMALVKIEDDGIGISPDVLPHIFELFTRDEHATDRPGLGVGLSVVQHLAALHGGSVEARSDGVGKGSSFGLRLPAVARSA